MVVSPSDINSVVRPHPVSGGVGDIVLWLAGVADTMPQWGSNFRSRDIKLREFYKSEPYLAGATYSITSRRASLRWELTGPQRQVNIMHRILHGSNHGRGWISLMIPFIKDCLTQENGGFLETVREEYGNYKSPVVQLNHLDAGRCLRTGNWETPVIYTDLMGGQHELRWYEVIDYTEYPDPDERARGYQQCAVSRILTRAQTIRDIGIFENEKIGGRNPSSIHLVGGVQQERINNILKLRQNDADQQGLLHYLSSPIIAALDPTSRVSHEQIDLKGVPDGYDPEKALRWYTLLIALCYGVDPQEIAPLPGGNLGSAQQSKVLQETGRGKGNSLFMNSIEHIMNFHGIMPNTVQFKYMEQDIAEDEQLTQLKWRRSQMYRMYAGSPGGNSGSNQQILPVEIIHQMMRDNGDLKQEYLDMMGETDKTPSVDRSGDDATGETWTWS